MCGSTGCSPRRCRGRGVRVSGDGRRRVVGRRRADVPARTRRHRELAAPPPPARQCLSRPELRRPIDDTLAAAGMRRLAGRPVEPRSISFAPARRARSIPAAWSTARARSAPARSSRARTTTRINDNLNKRLDRSEFMPFAPSCWKKTRRAYSRSPMSIAYAAHFMTITCGVRPEWRARIPAVVHVDGTARPQIVRDEDNPLFAGDPAAVPRRHRACRC